MPVTPTYPGVYVEEIPSGVRTITGVATSIAAFVGFFSRGPMRDEAVQIFNMGDFERELGGLRADSEASYAIQQFFLNGGTEAWVVRVASGNHQPSSGTIDDETSSPTLTVTAVNPGEWGDNLRPSVVWVGTELFNLTISEYSGASGSPRVVRQEVFRNLSMNPADTRFVDTVVNDPVRGSGLVRVTATGTARPAANGTFSGEHGSDPTLSSPALMDVDIGGAGGEVALAAGSISLEDLAPVLESAVRRTAPDNPAVAGVTVDVFMGRLHVRAGAGGDPSDTVVFTEVGNGSTADELNLLASGTTPPIETEQEYTLANGDDGVLPDANELIGNLGNKTGMYALEDVDLFNLLAIPRAAMIGVGGLTAAQAHTVITTAGAYCRDRRAFLLLDTPVDFVEPHHVKNYFFSLETLRNAAFYYPRVRVPDPLDELRLRSLGACGTIAGLYARTDSERGVWKAPAGTEARLRGVFELEDVLTDAENGTLNQIAVNCLRNFPVYGNIAWGARTMEGSDQQASEWKYVPVRRLALFLEESLYRGLKWVVFEPNDEPLWSQIRLNVGAFMNNLFRQGAFQGQTPREAYLVKCDAETTTQNDIDQGIVNIVVGFAPLKPAEFVIIKIQQLAGQIQT